jgi:hypothetical protein
MNLVRENVAAVSFSPSFLFYEKETVKQKFEEAHPPGKGTHQAGGFEKGRAGKAHRGII